MGESLGNVIKRMAIGATDANAPTSVLFGTVTSINPLEITVEQKLKLTKEFLILTKNVKDYTVDISMNWTTENTLLNANHNHTLDGNINIYSTATLDPNPENVVVDISNQISNGINIEQKNIDLNHNHLIKGRKQITVHNGLELNDNVILIQQQGGNNFVVIDKF